MFVQAHVDLSALDMLAKFLRVALDYTHSLADCRGFGGYTTGICNVVSHLSYDHCEQVFQDHNTGMSLQNS